MDQVLLGEVVGADAKYRMSHEFVQRHAIEVVAVAAETAKQAIGAGRFSCIATLEAVPGVGDTGYGIPTHPITGHRQGSHYDR